MNQLWLVKRWRFIFYNSSSGDNIGCKVYVNALILTYHFYNNKDLYGGMLHILGFLKKKYNHRYGDVFCEEMFI